MHYTELLKAREELTGPGGEFEIVEAEVLGNRLRVYKNAPPSVREVWLSTLQFADRDYLVYQDERWTYADAHREVAAAAAWLGQRCQKRRGLGNELTYSNLVPDPGKKGSVGHIVL